MAEDLIAAYLDHLNHRGRAARTIKDRGEMLRRMHRDLPHGLDLASEDELKTYIYRPSWKPASRHAALAGARSFYRWATRPGAELLDYDPTVLLPTPKVPKGVPRPPTDAQVEAILGGARDPYWLWLRLAAYQGLRCCEIADLNRQDVTELDTYVHGKGAKERIVPTDEQVWAHVRDLPPGPLARSLRRGEPCDARYLSRTINAYLDEIGVPDKTAHKFRAWYATKLLEDTGNVRLVQDLLGHETPATTAVYTAVPDRQKRAAVSRLPSFSGRRAA